MKGSGSFIDIGIGEKTVKQRTVKKKGTEWRGTRYWGRVGESVFHVSTSSHVRRPWQRRRKRPLPKASDKQTQE